MRTDSSPRTTVKYDQNCLGLSHNGVAVLPRELRKVKQKRPNVSVWLVHVQSRKHLYDINLYLNEH